MGVITFSPECATQWVQRTCKEQGLPEKVGDPEAVSQVVALLSSGARGTGGVAPGIKAARLALDGLGQTVYDLAPQSQCPCDLGELQRLISAD
jgi:hypothetical protein